MPHIQGAARDAVVLFPPSLDEYITDDYPVRFIDAFVAQLDLHDLGFTRAVASPLGRPAYHPGDLLKLYSYGYLNRIRSSRLLERAAQRNIEVMVIAIMGVVGLIAGLMERVAWPWGVDCWLIRVSQWCYWIRWVAWEGRVPAHQPTFHTV